jgi:hypothetical protein
LHPAINGVFNCEEYKTKIMYHKLDNQKKLSVAYYSPAGYFRGNTAVKKLSDVTNIPQKEVLAWLQRQDVWQIYRPAPKYIPRASFSITTPNEVHQADLLFLPHDDVQRSPYKYALTVVDVASRYKEAEPLRSKSSTEVAQAFSTIYSRSPLTWPQLLQVDPGREFMGAVATLFKKHNTKIRLGNVNLHRDQGIVERFNRTLAERLFTYQYDVELRNESSKRSVAWVTRLPQVVSAMNNSVTRLTGVKPNVAISKKRQVAQPARPSKTKQKPLELNTIVRYLYQPGELEGGRQRATDPIWSVELHRINRAVEQPGQPVLYYLEESPGSPKRSFVQEELQVLP